MSAIKKGLKLQQCSFSWFSIPSHRQVACRAPSITHHDADNSLQTRSWCNWSRLNTLPTHNTLAESRAFYATGYASIFRLNSINENPTNNKKKEQLIVNYPALDVIAKKVFLIVRNQFEELVHLNRLRVNGKLTKIVKNYVTKNDVIDIVRGYSISEPTKLVVSRIEILDISPRPIEKKVAVAIRRQKSLIIDNYPGDDAHVDKKAEEQFNPLSNQ